MRRVLRIGLIATLTLFLAIQLVPYGWWHANPPVTQDAPWPDAESAAIARESCYACHSNETDWPPHSYVAPFSWLVRRDVEEGRDELNFSTWNDYSTRQQVHKLKESWDQVAAGEMPPWFYLPVHRDARLSVADREILGRWARQP